MKAYHIVSGQNIDGLKLAEVARPVLAAHDIRVRVEAVSLNFRDLMVAKGDYPTGTTSPVIPCSDGAGEVIEVGSAVTRFKAGDRVMSSFYPDWIDGHPSPAKTAATFGAGTDGVLAEEMVMREEAAVTIPAHLSYIEASTMPCAAVTAWNALFVDTRLQPGADVLLLGTGGVSIWALQLAHAAGLRTIITSSSNEKLAKARALGAHATINYQELPRWEEEVQRITHGKGVELVLEVGGQGTLKSSVASTAMGGSIVIIGGVSGFGGELEPFSLIGGHKRLSGISVGSRVMLDGVSTLANAAKIRPVVDRVFDFNEAPAAFAYLDGARHFGKVVIAVNR